jgi:hypothetical protein
MADFSRLTAHWYRWAPGMGPGQISVETSCDDCEIMFSSNDYGVHLRHDATWWIVDTVDDRGQLHSDAAKLSSYDLAERYLIWNWASIARGARRLGPELYAKGLSPDVEAVPISEGIFELRSQEGNAILMEPDATIFSHLISKSVDEIERMVTAGLA